MKLSVSPNNNPVEAGRDRHAEVSCDVVDPQDLAGGLGQAGGQARFVTTRWSLVLHAGRESSPDSSCALEELCRQYWYPLYAFVRRQGRSPEEAEDLTQGFFEQLLRRDDLRKAVPERGRFRSFLLVAMKHYLTSEWVRAHRAKRGGHRQWLSLDDSGAEERFQLQAALSVGESPEVTLDREWALATLSQAMLRLEAESVAGGREALFRALKPHLSGDSASLNYAVWAESFRMTEGALKVAVHRMRRRFGELLRSIIAETVAEASDVDEEIRHLLRALRGK